MRVLLVSLLAVAVLATAWSFSLDAFQETAVQNNTSTSGSVRLDQQEAVNLLGREP